MKIINISCHISKRQRTGMANMVHVVLEINVIFYCTKKSTGTNNVFCVTTCYLSSYSHKIINNARKKTLVPYASK